MGVLRDLFSPLDPTAGLRVEAQLNPRTTSAGYYYTVPQAAIYPLSYSEAVQIPAVHRCLSLVKGVAAGLPLEMYDESTNAEVESPPEWLVQPDPRMTRGVQIAATVQDLAMYGLAYWQVLDVFPGTQKPSRFAYVNHQRVIPVYNRTSTIVDYYQVDGGTVPNDGVGSLITFQGLDEGALYRGKVALRRAYDLQLAGQNYANTPAPQGIIKNNGADLPQAEVSGLLNQWKNARKRGAVGYLSAQLEWMQSSYSPVEMALNEQIDNSDSQIAELFNIDPYWVNAQKSSMTYSNVRDVNRQFYQTSLRYYLDPIEQRLNMPDIGFPGFNIRFSLDEFLRTSPMERTQINQILFQNGVIDVTEWRQFEDLAPRGSADPEGIME